MPTHFLKQQFKWLSRYLLYVPHSLHSKRIKNHVKAIYVALDELWQQKYSLFNVW